MAFFARCPEAEVVEMPARSPDVSILDRAVFPKALKEVAARILKKKKKLTVAEFEALVLRTLEGPVVGRVAANAARSMQKWCRELAAGDGSVEH